MEKELLTLLEHLSSPPIISGVCVTRSLVLCVCFVDRCLSFCTFFNAAMYNVFFTYRQRQHWLQMSVSTHQDQRLTEKWKLLSTLTRKTRILRWWCYHPGKKPPLTVSTIMIIYVFKCRYHSIIAFRYINVYQQNINEKRNTLQFRFNSKRSTISQKDRKHKHGQ